MSTDRTPAAWPSEARGILDDIGRSRFAAAVREGLGRMAARLEERLSPRGLVNVGLATGQSLVLDGARGARMRCLEGVVWATARGRPDMGLREGEDMRSNTPGRLVVTAVEGTAWVRLGWM